jgi:hypothetical protein
MSKSVGFKLKVNWKPGAFHHHTVRKSVSQTLWKKIRNQVLDDNNKTCCTCGYTPIEDSELKELHVHEIEEYTDITTGELICTLKGLDLICEKCHSFHHWGRTLGVLSKEQQNDLIKHFIFVNQCTFEEFQEHLKTVGKEKKETFIKFLKETKNLPELRKVRTVRFIIDSEIPYKVEVITQLKKKGLYAE